jgi:Tfp pilus assembly protein PilX
MVVALMAMLVLAILAATILSLSHSEEFNQRREQRSVLAFYAADAGVNEAFARINLNPSGANNDETELRWDTATNQPRNPASVRDPRFIQNLAPDADPRNYTDSAVPTWRFWNYDPSWRYTGTSAGGEGNYPGATSAHQANLNAAGRAYSYDGSTVRSLTNGTGYTVRVVPHVRNFAGAWHFADARGNQAAPNWYYYKANSIGTFGGKTASIELILKKFKFGVNVPAAITAQGDIIVSGNGSVGTGDPGDEIANGVAIQSLGSVTQSGSGTISGSVVSGAPFPTFETIFGGTKTEIHSLAQSMGTAITGEPPSGAASYGKMYWVTPSGGTLLLTGSGSSGYVLGSPNEPVVLIVDGDLTLNSVTIYGAVYVTGTFRNQGSSHIRGAILVEGTAETDILGTGSEKEKIAYSQSVVNNLNNNPTLYPFTPLKGTWKINRG